MKLCRSSSTSTVAVARSGRRGLVIGVGPISVLSPVQDRFLRGFFADPDRPFYLSGGTALSAFYLRHRYSDDLDFFTRDPENLRAADRYIREGAAAAGLQIERVARRGDLLQYFFSGDPAPAHALVKSELMVDVPPYFADPRPFDGIKVDDLFSIALNKIACLGRREPKDYVDLYLILQSGRYTLQDLIPRAKEKELGLDELTIGADFHAVDTLPRLVEFQQDYMIVTLDLAEMRRFYREWAGRLFDLLPPRREA